MAPREVPGSGILTTEGLPTLFSCESNSYNTYTFDQVQL